MRAKIHRDDHSTNACILEYVLAALIIAKIASKQCFDWTTFDSIV